MLGLARISFALRPMDVLFHRSAWREVKTWRKWATERELQLLQPPARHGFRC
jgi:hypothetical protein